MDKMLKILLPGLLIAALCGCGSDDEKTGVSGNITGVAATGNAISNGIVTLKCAGGLSSASTTTNADGSFRFAVKNITLPCLAKVDFTDSNNNPYSLHSYISDTGTNNITSLTDLLLAALFLDRPDAVFSDANFKKFTSAERAAALAAVKNSLQAYGINLPADLDPVRDGLIAKTAIQNGNEHDQILDAMGLQLSLLGNPAIDVTLQINGSSSTVNVSSGRWTLVTGDGPVIGDFFSNPPLAGNEYIITQPDPTATLANYMSTHALAGSYTGTFANNGGNCSFTVNADASITSGFILPVAEGSNASTPYLIPASAFMPSRSQPANTWFYQDFETQRFGGLSIIIDSNGTQNLSFALLDANVRGPEACLASLSAH